MALKFAQSEATFFRNLGDTFSAIAAQQILVSGALCQHRGTLLQILGSLQDRLPVLELGEWQLPASAMLSEICVKDLRQQRLNL